MTLKPETVLTSSDSTHKPTKLLDQMRDVLRRKHYSLRTERTYCDWVERFIRFQRLRHPSDMGAAEITEFLTHLARVGNFRDPPRIKHLARSYFFNSTF